MITKFKLFETNTFNDLSEILLNLQPGEVKNGLDTEDEINDLINRGEEYDESFITHRFDGNPNQCHRNSANVYSDDSDEYTIVTGYAFYDGVWVSHTWLMDFYGDMIETVQTEYSNYFGYILNAVESKKFIDENN